jgi:polysaccharide pyruvyl transferase WcaK-like protein
LIGGSSLKVGFVGPFGDSNFGDYGMLINNINDIDIEDVTIFTYNIPLLNKLAHKYLRNYNLDLCEVNLIPETNPTELQKCEGYTIEYNCYPETPFEILKRVQNYQDIIDKIKRIDVLVVNGGGYFNHLWNAKHRRSRLLSIMVPILIANQLKKRIVFMGNTYGPFEDSSNFFGNFFNYLDNCIVASRDDLYSTSELRKVGYDRAVHYLPDDLYFLNKRFSNNHGLLELPKKYIVLEFYSPISEIEENLTLLGQFIAIMKDAYGCDTVFLPFDTNYGGEIQGKLMAKTYNGIYVYDISKSGFLDIYDANIIIKNAELIICNRYHAFLLAIANNIPTLQFLRDVCGDKRYYYNKSYGLLKNIFRNQTFNELDFFEENLSGAIRRCMNDYPEVLIKQKRLFNSEKIQQEKTLRRNRMQYIQDNICSCNDVEQNIP